MNDFNSMYNFVSGPLLWLTVIIFVCGSVYRIWNMFSLVNKKEKFIYRYLSLKFSLRSIMHWITPFATHNWRHRPVMTITTFVFHLGLVIMPFFISAHVIMFQDVWGFSWGYLPESFTDAVTFLVIICCVIFLLRRLALREVKFLTDFSDYFVLAIAAAPFVTGFLAYHHVGNYHFWVIFHMLSGEAMLIAIPFTRLTHMIYALFTRAYIGSEFGKVRHARDW